VLEAVTYDGDAQALSDFVLGVWRRTYAGGMLFPLWSPQFFDWQLTWPPPSERHYCVALREGEKMVGVLLAEEFRLRLFGREVVGAQGSWFTVDPEHRRRGAGTMLREELLRRLRARHGVVLLGWVFRGSRLSMGLLSWNRFPQPRAFGFWARVLNHEAVAAWEVNRLEGWGARALGLCQRGAAGRPPDPRVRPYRDTDLPACLELTRALLDGAQVGIVWDRDRLAHQLDYKGYPRTLVYDDGGRAAGFINYHVLEYLGRETIRVAMIDLLATGDLPGAAARALVRTALRQMHDDGVALALMLDTGSSPASVMWGTGFIPRLPDQRLLFVNASPDLELSRIAKIHLLWR
jgi:GNAT superfamily N-acetyltransferase